jgi:hypothetical protein
MSMITELFGLSVLDLTKEQVKDMINRLPASWPERKSYLLHDWAAITGIKLEPKDFEDVGGLIQ